MTADVRTFKAASMQEALEIVRREMGPEAVILHTRELSPPRLLSFLRSKERVEITAGLGVEPESRQSRSNAGSSSANRKPSYPSQNFGSTLLDDDRDEDGVEFITRTPAANPSSRNRIPPRRDSNLADPPQLLPSARQNTPSAPRNLPSQDLLPGDRSPKAEPSPKILPPQRRPVPAPQEQETESQQDYTLENLVPRVAPPQRQSRPQQAFSRTEQSSAISEQLANIRNLVENLGQKSSVAREEPIPYEWLSLSDHLHELGIDESLAHEWIEKLRLAPEITPQDRNLVSSRLQSFVESELNCSGPIRITPGQCRVVALIGPTGVGKTTTIAKLAAHYHLQEGLRTGLITVDTFRIAAVEQLRTYAEIIDLPMRVATNPVEFRQALAELEHLDLVFIDTAGRSPRDVQRIQELNDLLRHGEVHETHLVLSLVAGRRSLLNSIERFAPAAVTSLILSKLDEAPDLSQIIHLSRHSPWPLSYLTTGQEVPDDFEPARKSRLAKLILNLEHLSRRNEYPPDE